MQTGLQRVGAEFVLRRPPAARLDSRWRRNDRARFARHRPRPVASSSAASRAPACPTAGALMMTWYMSDRTEGSSLRRVGSAHGPRYCEPVPAQRHQPSVGEYSRQRQVVQSASLKRVHSAPNDGVECTMRSVLITWTDRGGERPRQPSAPRRHRRSGASAAPAAAAGAGRALPHRLAADDSPGAGGQPRARAALRAQVEKVEIRELSVTDPRTTASCLLSWGRCVARSDAAIAPRAGTWMCCSAGMPQAQTLWVILVQAGAAAGSHAAGDSAAVRAGAAPASLSRGAPGYRRLPRGAGPAQRGPSAARRRRADARPGADRRQRTDSGLAGAYRAHRAR